MARLVSLVILATLIVFLGITFFQVIAPFLLPLFLAAIVTVLCQPIFRYFLRRTKNRVRLAAALTTCSVLAMFVVPPLVGISIGSIRLYTLTNRALDSGELDRAVDRVRAWLDKEALFTRVQPYLPVDSGITDKEEQLAKQREWFDEQFVELQANARQQLKALAQKVLGLADEAVGITVGLLSSAVSALVAFLMFVIALYYFLADGPVLLSAAEGLIPVHAGYQRELLKQFDKVVRAVVLATFLAAIGQGLATAVALYLTGWYVGSSFMCHFFIFLIISTIASLIPLAGTWLIWGPCAIWLFFNGDPLAASFLVVFGSIGIGTLDNVIRAYVLHTDAKLHPLLAFVSVLGGLQVMGLWGVFIGPIVACCLHALIQIFNTELKEFSKERHGQFAKQADTQTVEHKQGAKDDRNAAERTESADAKTGEAPAKASDPTASGTSNEPSDDKAPSKTRKRSRRRRRKKPQKPAS